MDLSAIEQEIIDGRTKGMPPGMPPVALRDIGKQGWNLLREDLPLPLAVIKQSALDQNSHFMREFLARTGAVIAPHGKTTMSPQLFAKQFDDGAWAITVATAQQMKVAHRFGVERIVIANQLIGKQAIRYAFEALKADPKLDLYCLVDSVENVTALRDAAAAIAPGRPLKLLLEGGLPGGRTGCRSVDAAVAVARAVKAAAPHLTLVGVEGFEGLAFGDPPKSGPETASAFLDLLLAIAKACDDQDLFAPQSEGGEVILSAGGSAYYDIVVDKFKSTNLRRPTRVVTRSGCYLTHDSKLYDDFFKNIVGRSADAAAIKGGLIPALEVWAYVQSRPEPGKAILTVGRRDISFDVHLPVPQLWARPGANKPQRLSPAHTVTGLNDQHCHMALPADSPLAVGDMVSFGISHPCTTFDKWQVLCLVDDDYSVIGAIKTFF
ncbi:MAG TPA: alanine racemase [Magnetospirillaceae bacterium]|jgi:D-serine dehydratase